MILADSDATRAMGALLATHLEGGDCIALVGDLGVGKTTLVGGLVTALGAGMSSSPTFSLVNEYVGGRLIVWHVDLYRIDRESELRELGLEEMLGDRRGVCVVEWADKYAVMPPDHLHVQLAHVRDVRSIEFVGTGPRGKRLAELLQTKP